MKIIKNIKKDLIQVLIVAAAMVLLQVTLNFRIPTVASILLYFAIFIAIDNIESLVKRRDK